VNSYSYSFLVVATWVLGLDGRENPFPSRFKR
jgi:hypothetical protein